MLGKRGLCRHDPHAAFAHRGKEKVTRLDEVAIWGTHVRADTDVHGSMVATWRNLADVIRKHLRRNSPTLVARPYRSYPSAVNRPPQTPVPPVPYALAPPPTLSPRHAKSAVLCLHSSSPLPSPPFLPPSSAHAAAPQGRRQGSLHCLRLSAIRGCAPRNGANPTPTQPSRAMPRATCASYGPAAVGQQRRAQGQAERAGAGGGLGGVASSGVRACCCGDGGSAVAYSGGACMRCRSCCRRALPCSPRAALLAARYPALRSAHLLPCPAARASPCRAARASPCPAARAPPCPAACALPCPATYVAASGGGQQQQCQPKTLSLQQLRKWVIQQGRPGGGGYGFMRAGGTGQQRRSHCQETLSPQQLREWVIQRGRPGGGGYGAGGTGQQHQHRQQETLLPQQPRDWVSQRCVLGSAEATSLGATALGASEYAAPLGASASAATGASESATCESAASAEALHTFTLDSGASRCFFQDAWVDTFTPGGQRVAICTCSRTGHHLATFTRQPGSSMYTLTTASAQTLLWHHRLGHPSLPRLRSMHSRLLVSGLPRSLPPLPRSLAPPCLPCVEGWQRPAPHSSSFPPTTAPLQTLHMDVWGPALVHGTDQERYFLLVVDDYTRYTTVFPLRSKAKVRSALIPWIRATRHQLRERFRRDLLVLRLHSDMGETSPTLRWTGQVGDESAFWVWGALSLVRDTTASKLSPRTLRCTFLGFPTDAPRWQFYYPHSRRVFSSQDVTFDEPPPSIGSYSLWCVSGRPTPLVEPLVISFDTSGPVEGGDPAADDTATSCRFPRLETPPGFRPRPSSLSLQLVAVDTGAAGGGDTGDWGEGSGGADSGGADSGGAVSPSGGGPVGAPTAVDGTGGAGGARAAGAGGAGAAGAGGTGGAGGARAAGTRAAGTRGAGAAGAGGAGGASGSGGNGGAGGASTEGTGGAGRGGAGASDTGGTVTAGAGGARAPGTGGASAGGTGAADGTGTAPRQPFFYPQPHLSLPPPESTFCQVIAGEYSSHRQTAMDTEMASWKSTGTYVDEVPPPGANIVDGMWIFRVKRPPNSPPAFKACYVSRGFSQGQGVDFFHTFSAADLRSRVCRRHGF
ncbi:unnamed protein product [Closterium sp. NIES-54]